MEIILIILMCLAILLSILSIYQMHLMQKNYKDLIDRATVCNGYVKLDPYEIREAMGALTDRRDDLKDMLRLTMFTASKEAISELENSVKKCTSAFDALNTADGFFRKGE